jgi:hypothetical protein
MVYFAVNALAGAQVPPGLVPPGTGSYADGEPVGRLPLSVDVVPLALSAAM